MENKYKEKEVSIWKPQRLRYSLLILYEAVESGKKEPSSKKYVEKSLSVINKRVTLTANVGT